MVSPTSQVEYHLSQVDKLVEGEENTTGERGSGWDWTRIAKLTMYCQDQIEKDRILAYFAETYGRYTKGKHKGKVKTGAAFEDLLTKFLDEQEASAK